MKYVISDLHGCYDSFMEMLDLIGFNSSDTLYILGDIVDRGPAPVKLIEYIMARPNMTMILGNHEDMMLQVIHERDYESYAYSRWMRNGGNITLAQFDALSPSRQEEVTAYLDSLEIYLIEGKFFLVHAGLNIPKQDMALLECLRENTREDFLWIRDEFIFSPNSLKDYTVIFGHTPTVGYSGPSIWKSADEKKICIDCGKVFADGNAEKGRLAVLRLDDMAEFYV